MEVAKWNEMWDDIDFSIWDEYPTIRLSTPWFSAFRLPGNVIAIYEPLHNQRVSAFLILGDDKALLLDTCIGIQNVREVVDELTDLPVTVLNSHDHFDHIGGNSYFDEVWCYNTPGTVEGLIEEPDEIILNEIYSREKSLYPIIEVVFCCIFLLCRIKEITI